MMQPFQAETVITLILSLTTNVLEGSRILFLFPIPGKSHFVTFSVLAEELARRGHEVTMVTAHPLGKTVPNYHEILLDKEKTFGDVYKEHNYSLWKDKSLFGSAFDNWRPFPEWVAQALATEPMESLLNSSAEFDLIMAEFLFHQHLLLAFGHRFKAPLIDLCPGYPYLSTSALMGNPQAFSYLPDTDIEYSDQMTFLERVHNTIYGFYKIAGTYMYSLPLSEELMRKSYHYPGVKHLPPVTDLVPNISLVLMNSHFSFHYTRPYASNMIEIGGFHVKTPKPLPPDLQRFMDEATDGVIFMSFGTNIKQHMMSKDKEEAFLSVFRGVKQRVLWRWDNEDLMKGSSKILVRKWFPQQSVLAHGNCVLYMTHGGMASLIEAVHYGVPMVVSPFFVDQFHNAEYIQKSGIGIRLDPHQINRDSLLHAVNTVINTPSEKVQWQSRLLHDQPQSPMDRAVFWVEYVIRHKGAHHLKPASVYLPFYQYILLDVIAFIALIAFLVYRFIRFVLKAVFTKENTKKLHLKDQ